MALNNKQFKFKNLVWDFLGNLPKKHQDVIVKRFGLESKEMTLEAIGGQYDITRERVRQIEADALSKLQNQGVKYLAPAFEHLHNYLDRHGDVVKEDKLFSEAADDAEKGYLKLVMDLNQDFYRHPETSEFHPRWARSDLALKGAEKLNKNLVNNLKKISAPVSGDQMIALASEEASNIFKKEIKDPALLSYIGISSQIAKNPFGQFGLKDWLEISPRGVRDKAFMILKKTGKPLHFRQVASLINSEVGGRPALDQTVHNELIKDPRFVLVGRGLYALSNWGFEPGTVKDVIISVLKEKQPLSKEEIIKRTLDKRFVKENTILLNLQNDKYFIKKDGNYSLKI